MKNESIYNFLISEGFVHKEKKESNSFGDYYDLFAKGTLKIRFSGSKSTEAVDIGCPIDNDNWYDLALVKALLLNERKLNIETSIDKYTNFIQKHLSSIVHIFEDGAYIRTKKMLDELEDLRIKQMFPGV